MSRLMEVSRMATPLYLRSFYLNAVNFSPFSRDSHEPLNPNFSLHNIQSYSSSSSQNPNSINSTSYYMNRIFPKSNTSFQLTNGISLKADVLRLNERMFLVDSGIGTPRTCLEDQLIGVKNNPKTRFENKVGFMDLVAGETVVRKFMLERIFIDLVAGDLTAKERAYGRFNDLVAESADADNVVAGEPLLVLPRRYRQKRVSMELRKIWRTNSQVKGFYVKRVKGGYAVAVAGYIAFAPFRGHFQLARGGFKDRFTIESLNLKDKDIVVV
ncbi:uncharacterized protein LOC130808715 [Amaranthus tricolor]|uniref:uncharacterized protein LOC130808715 n=1 Tax=Amaranthus tricolor TaxID=29722 RepID=UPI00258A9AF3|nr:uncharacterized protein LOC130808715 [Amaranthus tricolor]